MQSTPRVLASPFHEARKRFLKSVVPLRRSIRRERRVARQEDLGAHLDGLAGGLYLRADQLEAKI